MQETREIGRNVPGVDLGMNGTKNSFHEGGNKLDNKMLEMFKRADLASSGKWLMMLSTLSKPGEDFVFNKKMAILSSFSEKEASRNWLGSKPSGNLSWKNVVGHISKTSSCSLTITSLSVEQVE